MKKLISIFGTILLILSLVSAIEGIELFDDDNIIDIYEIVADESGRPCTGCTVNLTLYFSNGTANQSHLMNELTTGIYNQTLGKLTIGFYPLLIEANKSGFNGTSDRIGIQVIDKKPSFIGEQIYNLSIKINETTTNLSKDFSVFISDVGEVLATKQYKVTLVIMNAYGNPIDADAAPSIKLEDPINQEITSTTMTKSVTGVYVYNYTTASVQTDGIWTATINGTVGAKSFLRVDYWELESNPAEVTITNTDYIVPDIECEISISNEGSSNQEYQYRWWVTNVSSGQFDDGTALDSGSAAKLVQPGKTFSTRKQLTLTQIGIFYCKVEVFYGTEKSGASVQFSASKSVGTGGTSSVMGRMVRPVEEFRDTALFNIFLFAMLVVIGGYFLIKLAGFIDSEYQ